MKKPLNWEAFLSLTIFGFIWAHSLSVKKMKITTNLFILREKVRLFLPV